MNVTRTISNGNASSLSWFIGLNICYSHSIVALRTFVSIWKTDVVTHKINDADGGICKKFAFALIVARINIDCYSRIDRFEMRRICFFDFVASLIRDNRWHRIGLRESMVLRKDVTIRERIMLIEGMVLGEAMGEKRRPSWNYAKSSRETGKMRETEMERMKGRGKDKRNCYRTKLDYESSHLLTC